MVTGPTAHLCFFSFLHECVLPGEEGDQDGSLSLLLCLHFPPVLLFFYFEDPIEKVTC